MNFQQFLEETAAKGEVINLIFEERLFNLFGVLQRFAEPLDVAGIPDEVIGGLAVLIHVEEANSSQSVLTRDVDMLIRRGDLEPVIAAAESADFQFRHAAGVDMLLFGGQALNPVHLVFAEGKVKACQTS